MKKLFILVALAVLSVNAFAQTAFDYLIKSLSNVLSASTIMQLVDYDYNGANSLWGTYLEPGKSVSLYSQYDGGIEYLMFASAHTTMADIDLKIYRGKTTDGTVITKDTAPDATPIVRFTPSSSEIYTFELINSGTGPAFVSLVVLKQSKNPNFSLYSLAEALGNTLDISQHLVTMLPPNSKIPANKWTLFGGNIRQGSAAGYFNTQLEKGSYVLVGSGDDSVNNCDVEVIEQYAVDNTNGRKISQNTDSRFPFDFAILSPNPSKYHNLKVINQNSQNSSAFMFGFLILAQ